MNYGMRPSQTGRKILAVLAAETAYFGMQDAVSYDAALIERSLDDADIGKTNIRHQLEWLTTAGYVRHKIEPESGASVYRITLVGMRVALGVLG